MAITSLGNFARVYFSKKFSQDTRLQNSLTARCNVFAFGFGSDQPPTQGKQLYHVGVTAAVS
jgi:hypothetical protein